MEQNIFKKSQRGYFLATILVFAAAIIIITTSLIYVSINQKRHLTANLEKASARQIAEAGINYYLWHLTQDNEDYADGTGETCGPTCGPYVHDYTDSRGEVIGTYSLIITPPAEGTELTYASVSSTGQLTGSTEKKTIEAQLGIPSFARYGFVSTDELWFGADEDSNGPIHSNKGVRYDGIAEGIVTASCEGSSRIGQYKATQIKSGDSGWHPCVWCSIDNPKCPNLLGGFSFPVPSVDFTKLAGDLKQMQEAAQIPGKGFYLPYTNIVKKPKTYYRGYHIILKQDGTFDLYKVLTTVCKYPDPEHPTADCKVCTQSSGKCNKPSQKVTVTDDIATETSLGNYSYPENGIIFVEDNLWIEGTINGTQLTFAAARLPEASSPPASIVINGDLLYTNYDGTDKIGLITQKWITLPSVINTDLEIDAAMISKNSYVEWHFYENLIYDQIKIYGSIATHGGLVWSWWGNNDKLDSGYAVTNVDYDKNLTFNPPPSFPVTGAYTILSWEEK